MLSSGHASLVFAAGTALVRLPDIGLFDLHPLCAWLSLVVVSSGVSAASAAIGQKAVARQARINAHAQRQWSAVGLLAVLLAVVEYGKFSKGYGHFVSWHGCVAAAAIASLGSQAVAGFWMHNYPAAFKALMPHHKLWQFHRAIGRLNVTLLGVALVLGFYSGWAAHVVTTFDALAAGAGTAWWYSGVALVVAVVAQTVL